MDIFDRNSVFIQSFRELKALNVAAKECENCETNVTAAIVF